MTVVTRYLTAIAIQTMTLGPLLAQPASATLHSITKSEMLAGQTRGTWQTPLAGAIGPLALAPDGKLLAIAIGGTNVELRDRATGSVVRTIENQGMPTTLEFSPDGKALAVAAINGPIRVWNVKDGTLRSELTGHVGQTNAVAWSADGKRIVSGGNDKTVRLWDAASRKELAILGEHAGAVHGVGFSPDGKRVVSGGTDLVGRVWDVEKRQSVATLTGHAAALKAAMFAPDGKTIVTASNDGNARLWDATSYRTRATLTHQEPITKLAFAPGGQLLAIGGEKGSLRLWEVARGTAGKRLAEHFAAVTGLAFLPDGSGLISSSADQTIRLWKSAGEGIAPLVVVSAHRPESLDTAFSPDGKWLITTGADRAIAIRDPVNGNVRRTLRGHTNRVYRAAVSSDSQLIASISSDGTARVWSLASGEQKAMFNAWRDKFASARAVAITPNGQTVASGADDGTIKLWSVAEQREVQVFEEQSLPITDLTFSPDGTKLISSTGDWRNNRETGELKVWETTSGKELTRFEGHAGEIKCVAIDSKGKQLAASGADRTVRVWSLNDYAPIASFRLESTGNSLAFSTDGTRLAVGQGGGGVGIWNLPEGAASIRFAGHTKLVTGVAFNPDNKLLATAGHDGVVKLWPVAVKSE